MRKYRLPGRPGMIQLRARILVQFGRGADIDELVLSEEADILRIIGPGVDPYRWVYDVTRMAKGRYRRW